MSASRWQMNRAGLFNFWFFTDEVFQLSDGRLILRGPNGAGKSVTMQSFLPLVLDGDKRPQRLDPFGSKDRKMEYYLLGSSDSGIADRTAYLYLEFIQPLSGKTVTVGIGLRARRGMAQVNFWGFALTDGRRIGEDFFLYDERVFEREGEKLPLDRAALEAAIGEGGKVVREQGEYRQLVNQLLFGFADDQAYKDLLTLLIQVRSPKLSKEFRPSTIYTILNSSLPPLAEDELRPLSDVLQDMDEIGDRLDELVIHQGAAKRLDARYQRYNEIWLYETGKRVVEAAKTADRAFQEVDQHTATLQQAVGLRSETETALKDATLARDKTEAELDSFEHSEAMGIQKELESSQERLRDTELDVGTTTEREAANRESVRRKQIRVDAAQRKLESQQVVQTAQLAKMDEIAQAIEFADHAAYANHVRTAGEASDDATWSRWAEDVDAYRATLEEAAQLCTVEQEQQVRVRDAERQMSEARARRDECEQVVQAQEKELDNAIARQEDSLFAWFKSLTQLPLSEAAWRQMIHGLRQYGQRTYDQIVTPAKAAFDDGRAAVTEEQLRLAHAKQLKVAAQDELKLELEDWRTVRNPEPLRTEARFATRERRLQSLGQAVGAPLYMVCEFRDEVDEPTRAALETALHQAGLLDAWVAPLQLAFAEDDEDVWLRPNPALFGYTLADYLEPTPPEDCGLSGEQVEDILRTIRIGDAGEADAAVITAEGQYLLGPLSGQVVRKPCAQWIGYEARKRARNAAIERLRQAISALDDEIADVDRELEAVLAQLTRMQAEFAALPADEDLRACADMLDKAKRDFSHALEVEAKSTSVFRECQLKWQEAKQALLAFTSRWQTLRTTDDFKHALAELRWYERAHQACQASFQLAGQMRAETGYLADEIAQLEERIDSDLQHLAALHSLGHTLQSKVSSLQLLLQELGVLDVYEKQQSLKAQLVGWRQKVDTLQSRMHQCAQDCGRAEANLQSKQQALAQEEQHLERHTARFRQEWDLRLVRVETLGENASVELTGRQATLKVARDVHRTLKATYDSQSLQQVSQHLQESFAVEKNTLLDYSLEARFDTAMERLFVVSVRDTHKSWTPRQIDEELTRMVEEQRVLISEKDRELYEQILIHSVGRAIRDKINRAEQWVKQMNRFMSERKTSNGLILALEWKPRPAQNERELDTERLVYLLRKSPSTLLEEEMEDMIEHFRSRIRFAKEEAEQGETLRKWIGELLDYRSWFSFTLYFRKGSQSRRELTDSQFNVMSGGEKAMSMYIPLFAATDSRFKDSNPDAPRIISLDEAFAGVDDENMRDMFLLLTEMEFDFMMTSQQLWGCYDTVPSLSIYEVHRLNDADFVTLIPYYWNGHKRQLVGDWTTVQEVAATEE